MKKIPLISLAALLCIVAPAFAQQQPALISTISAANPEPSSPVPAPYGPPPTRWLFPHNWLRGHLDFDVAPSHNELDLGRCSELPAGQFGGVNAPCAAFARYVLSGYVEVQPFGRTVLRHAFVFFNPQFYFGRNVPQFLYTASFAPIADEMSVGLGVELPKSLEFRVTAHRDQWLGRYSGNLGPADLGTVGPYGDYATVGLRWNFGGWGRSHSED